ncbi:MAG: hypothetical protein HWE27_10995 [Gammaproteobacteria bacterium]|nr:hypothetical protein [Gammaproteobacteria bacterium]
MTALVSGLGLGVFQNSLTQSNASNPFGQNLQDQLSLNVTSGNLVVQRHDQFIFGKQSNSKQIRTYNAQGLDNESGFIWGFHQRIIVKSGQVNSEGSEISRITQDGFEQTFRWSDGRYISEDGAGAHDELFFEQSNKIWRFIEDGKRRELRFDQSGRLHSEYFENTLVKEYHYLNGELSRVTDASNQSTHFVWQSGRLSQVYSQSNGETTRATHYRYDQNNRLEKVIVDLSPEDNSIADQNIYTTQYSYWGDSHRIRSITDPGNKSVFIGYKAEITDGQSVFAVSDITDALGNKVTFNYNFANRTTDVTRNGVVTHYQYDSQGNVTQIDQSAAGHQQVSKVFTYDEQSNLKTFTDERGRVTEFDYDANGNLTFKRDAVGEVTRQFYNNQNQLERVLQFHESSPADAKETHYIYDEIGNLLFIVSPEKRVIAHSYQQFERVASRSFKLSYQSEISLSALQYWASNNLSQTATLTKYQYDWRGFLSEQTEFQKLDDAGNGILDAFTTKIYFTYNAQGQLLNTTSDHSNSKEFQSWQYDGLGRELVFLNASGETRNTIYFDQERRLLSTSANGVTTEQRFDQRGLLIESSLVGNQQNSNSVKTTKYTYDSQSRLIAKIGEEGFKQFYLYDERDRNTAIIEQDGKLTEFRYNEKNQIEWTIGYENAVDQPITLIANQLSINTVEQIKLSVSEYDRKTHFEYDELGRLKRETNNNLLTEYFYRDSSQLIESVRSTDQDSGEVRQQRFAYDEDGLLVAEQDAEGYIKRHKYDGSSQLVETRRLAAVHSLNVDLLGELDESLSDQRDHFFYDAKGELQATLDHRRVLTETTFNHQTRTQTTTVFQNFINDFDLNIDDVDSLRARASSTQDAVSTKTFDANSRLISESNRFGQQTEYRYNSNGLLAEITVNDLDAGTTRSNLQFFDEYGRLSVILNAKGSALYHSNLAEEQRQAILDDYGTQYQYDDQDRLKSIRNAEGEVSRFWYNETNNRTLTINDDGNITETVENQFGEVETTIAYANRLSTALDLDSIDNSIFNLIDDIADPSQDRVTQTYYDQNGNLRLSLDGEGLQSVYRFNAFGNLTYQNHQLNHASSLHDKRSREMSFEYDRRGFLEVEKTLNGSETFEARKVYDAFGRLRQHTNAMGQVRLIDYQNNDRLQVITHHDDSTSEIEFDSLQRTVRETDQQGSTQLTQFEQNGKKIIRTSAEGYRTETFLNADGNKLSVTDHYGSETEYQYNESGQIKEVFKDGELLESYDYDELGRVESKIIYIDSETQRTERFEYDASGNKTLHEISDGELSNTQTWSYDALGQTVTYTDEDNTVTEYRYNHNQQLTDIIEDANGIARITHFEVDADGNQLMKQVGRVINDTPVFERETLFQYDSLGRLTSETLDPKGRALTTTYQYNKNDQLVATSSSGLAPEQFFYSDDDRQLLTVSASGQVSHEIYDSLGRVVESVVYNEMLTSEQLADISNFNELKQLTEQFDLTQAARDFTVYDQDGRVYITASDSGRLVRHQYHKGQRRVDYFVYQNYDLPMNKVGDEMFEETLINFASHNFSDYITTDFFDSSNRLNYQIDADKTVRQFEYNRSGQLVSQWQSAEKFSGLLSEPSIENFISSQQSHPNNSLSFFEYDSLGRKSKSFSVLERTSEQVTLSFNTVEYKDLELVEIEQAGTIAVDDLEANSIVTSSDLSAFVLSNFESLNKQVTQSNINHYDELSRLYQVNDQLNQSSISQELNIVDQIEKSTDQLGHSNYQLFDSAGFKRFEISSLGQVTEYQYNEKGQLSKEIQYSQFVDTPSEQTLATIATNIVLSPDSDRVTYYFYDQAGNAEIIIDGKGNVSWSKNVEQQQLVQEQLSYFGLFKDSVASLNSESYSSILNKLNALQPTEKSRTYLDSRGNVIATLDNAGFISTHAYNDRNQRISTTKCSESVSQFFNTVEELLTATNQLSIAQKVERQYSKSGYLDKEIVFRSSGNEVATRQYNAKGQLISETSGGQTTHYIVNAAGQVRFEINSLGEVSELRYHANGQIDMSIQYAHAINLDAHDNVQDFDLSWVTADADKDRFSFVVYNDQQQVAYTLSSEGKLTQFRYNARGEKIRELSYLETLGTSDLEQLTANFIEQSSQDNTLWQQEKRWFYDADGLVRYIAHDDGRLQSFEYDALGQLIRSELDSRKNIPLSIQDAVELSGWLVQQPTFTPDGTGRKALQFYDASGMVRFETNARGFLSENIQVNAFVTVQRRYNINLYDAGQLRPSDQPWTLNEIRGLIQSESTQPEFKVIETVSILDERGQLRFSIDGDGYIQEQQHNALGQVVKTIAHGQVSVQEAHRYGSTLDQPAGTGASSSLDALTKADWQTMSASRFNQYIESSTKDSYAHDTATFYFYDRGRLSFKVDGTGAATQYLYNDRHLVETEIRYAERLPIDALTPQSNISAMIQANPEFDQVKHFEYDELGREKVVTDALGYEHHTYYNAFGEVDKTIKDFTGDARTKTYHYSRDGELIKTVTGINDEQQVVERNTYDARGQIKESFDGENSRFQYLYNKAGQLIAELNGEGELVHYGYNDFGEVRHQRFYAQRVSDENRPTAFANDEELFVWLELQQSTDDRTAYFQYNELGDVKYQRDQQGWYTNYTFDAFNRVETVTQTVGTDQFLVTDYEYDNRGNVIYSLKDRDGEAIFQSQGFNAQGLLAWQTDFKGMNSFTYDGVGQQIEHIDETGERIKHEYDAFGRLKSITDALGHYTTYSYNKNENSLTVTSPEGIVTKTFYNAFGDTVEFIDGENNKTTYHYNQLGKVERVVDALGQEQSYTFNLRGQTKTVTGKDGLVTEYEYDSENRVLKEIVHASSGDEVSEFQFNAFGEQTLKIDRFGDHHENVYFNQGKTVRQIKDKFGRGLTTQLQYNGHGKIVLKEQWEASQSDKITTTKYQYDNLGRLKTQIDDPDGLALETHYSYNDGDQVVRSDEATGGVSNVHYDARGQVQYQRQENGVLTEFVYDVKGQLVEQRVYLEPITEGELSSLINGWFHAGEYHTTRFFYDKDGRQIAQQDARGLLSITEYDNNGLVAHQYKLNEADSASVFKYLGLTPEAFQYNPIMQGTEPSSSDWYIYDADPSDVKVEEVFDEQKQQNVIHLNGTYGNGFRLNGIEGSTYWPLTSIEQLQIQVKPESQSNYYLNVETTEGRFLLTYTTRDIDTPYQKNEYLYFGLGNDFPDGNWHNLTLNIADDLAKFYPDAEITRVRALLVRGHNSIGTVRAISQSSELGNTVIPELTSDNLATAWETFKLLRAWHDLGLNNPSTPELDFDRVRLNEALAEYSNDDLTLEEKASLWLHLQQESNQITSQTKIYDELGREQFVINSNESVLEKRYDATNRVVEKIQYANITLAQLVNDSFDATVSLLPQRTANSDKETQYLFDDLGQLRYEINQRKVTEYQYSETNGKLARTIAYANPLSITNSFVANPVTLETIESMLLTSSDDRHTHVIYNQKNQVQYKIGPSGDLQQFSYDHQGNIQTTTTYNTRLDTQNDWTIANLDFIALKTSDKQVSATAFDALGRKVVERDSLGFFTVYEYRHFANGEHEIETVRFDATIDLETFKVEDLRNAHITSIINSFMPVRTWRNIEMFNGAGELIRETDALGNSEHYKYNHLGKVTEHTNKNGHTEYFYYDKVGNLTATFSPTEVQYDESLIEFNEIDFGGEDPSVGYIKLFEYDKNNQLIEERFYQDEQSRDNIGEPAGNFARKIFSYDKLGNVTQTQVFDVNEKLIQSDYKQYDSFSQITSHIQGYGTPASHETRFEYDDLGRMTRKIDAYNTADQAITQFEYDEFGQNSKVISPLGYEITETDSDWARSQRKYLGYSQNLSDLSSLDIQQLLELYSTQQAFDASNKKISQTNGLGEVTETKYDAFGNIVHTTYSDGREEHYYYNEANQLILMIDAMGRGVETRYNAIGQMTHEIRYDVSLEVSTLSINSNPQSLLEQLKEGNKLEKQYQYDELGRKTRERDAAGNWIEYEYDKISNIVLETNQMGIETHFLYDGLGRKRASQTNSKITDIDHLVARFSYDMMNREIQIDKAYRSPNSGYDGPVIELTGFSDNSLVVDQQDAPETNPVALSFITESKKSFNILGQIASSTNLAGQTTSYAYDSVGNVLTETNSYGGVKHHYYNDLQQKVATVDEENYLSLFDYDKQGNVINEKYYGTALSEAPSIHYSKLSEVFKDSYREKTHVYDILSRIVESKTSADWLVNESLEFDQQSIIISRKYDAQGNVISETDGRGNTTQHYYDLLGNKLLTLNAENELVRYRYDGFNRLVFEDQAGERYSGLGGVITNPPIGINLNLNSSSFGNANSLIDSNSVTIGNQSTVNESTQSSLSLGLSLRPSKGLLNNFINGLASDKVITKQYTYDQNNRITEIRILETNLSYYWNQNTSKSSSSATGDHVTKFVYNDLGGLEKQEVFAEVFFQYFGKTRAGKVYTTDYEYDSFGRVISEKSPSFVGFNNQNLRTVKNTKYNAVNQITELSYGSKKEQLYFYDNGRLAWTNGFEGEKYYSYDENGNLESEFNKGLKRRETRIFDNRGLVKEVEIYDAESQYSNTLLETRNFRYNAYGEVSEQGVNGNYYIENQYDKFGNLTLTNQENGVYTRLFYDKSGNTVAKLTSDSVSIEDYSIAQILAMKPTSTYRNFYISHNQYDDVNRHTSSSKVDVSSWLSIDGNEQKTVGDILKSYLPQSSAISSRTYNAFGQVSEFKDAKNNVTKYEYDKLGNMTKEILPSVDVWHENGYQETGVKPIKLYEYNVVGEKISETDANNNKTNYKYAHDNVTETIYADGNSRRREYDEYGELRATYEEGGLYAKQFDWVGIGAGAKRVTSWSTKAGSDEKYYEYTYYDVDNKVIKRVREEDIGLEGYQHYEKFQNIHDYEYDALGRLTYHKQSVKRSANNYTRDVSSESHNYDRVSSEAKSIAGVGGTITRKTNAIGKSLVEYSDYFNRLHAQVDYSGHEFNWDYNAAGQVTRESSKNYLSNIPSLNSLNSDFSSNSFALYSGGPSSFGSLSLVDSSPLNGDSLLIIDDDSPLPIPGPTPPPEEPVQRFTGKDTKYEYDGYGNLVKVNDVANKRENNYDYDKAGNRDYEELRFYDDGQWQTHQKLRVLYDSHNRARYYYQSLGGDNYFNVALYYDAVGNVRRKKIYSPAIDVNGAKERQRNDFWYAYDERNRMTISQGRVGKITRNFIEFDRPIGGMDGYWITYFDEQEARSKNDSSISIHQEDGHQIRYDDTGRRKSFTSGLEYSKGTETRNRAITNKTEYYEYDDNGYLEEIRLSQYSKKIYERGNDHWGRVIRETEYEKDGNKFESSFHIYGVHNQKVRTVSTDYRVDSWNKGTTTDFEYSKDGRLLESHSIKANQDNSTTKTYTYYLYTAYGSSYKQHTVISSKDGKVNKTEISFDRNGNEKGATVEADRQSRELDYKRDAEGKLIQRFTTPFTGNNDNFKREHRYFYFNGKAIGDVGDDGTTNKTFASQLANNIANYGREAKDIEYDNYGSANKTYDFDSNLHFFSGSANSQFYTASGGETLRALAQSFYGDSSLWYVIADKNGLSADTVLSSGQQVLITSSVQAQRHNNDTFRAFSSQETMRDIMPPAPVNEKNCETLKIITIIAVTIIVSILTYGAATAALGTSGFALLAAGGISAAAGSSINQGLSMEFGFQNEFDWGALAKETVVGAISGAAGSSFGGGKLSWGNAAMRGVTTGAINGISNVVYAAFNREKFTGKDWLNEGLNFATSVGTSLLSNVSIGKMTDPKIPNSGKTVDRILGGMSNYATEGGVANFIGYTSLQAAYSAAQGVSQNIIRQAIFNSKDNRKINWGSVAQTAIQSSASSLASTSVGLVKAKLGDWFQKFGSGTNKDPILEELAYFDDLKNPTDEELLNAHPGRVIGYSLDGNDPYDVYGDNIDTSWVNNFVENPIKDALDTEVSIIPSKYTTNSGYYEPSVQHSPVSALGSDPEILEELAYLERRPSVTDEQLLEAAKTGRNGKVRGYDKHSWDWAIDPDSVKDNMNVRLESLERQAARFQKGISAWNGNSAVVSNFRVGSANSREGHNSAYDYISNLYFDSINRQEYSGNTPKRTVVVVTGGTSSSGTNEFNEDLGMKRGLTAQQELIMRGVPEQAIIVNSSGEEQLLVQETTPEIMGHNRASVMRVGEVNQTGWDFNFQLTKHEVNVVEPDSKELEGENELIDIADGQVRVFPVEGRVGTGYLSGDVGLLGLRDKNNNSVDIVKVGVDVGTHTSVRGKFIGFDSPSNDSETNANFVAADIGLGVYDPANESWGVNFSIDLSFVDAMYSKDQELDDASNGESYSVGGGLGITFKASLGFKDEDNDGYYTFCASGAYQGPSGSKCLELPIQAPWWDPPETVTYYEFDYEFWQVSNEDIATEITELINAGNNDFYYFNSDPN